MALALGVLRLYAIEMRRRGGRDATLP